MMTSVTVKWILLSLNLIPYSHVSIRRHLRPGIEYLGGGSVGSCIRRFGDLLLDDSCIVDNVLVIYVF